MDNLRQRVPFKFSSEGTDEPLPAIIDEQEQEYIIETIRQDNERANVLHTWSLRALVFLCIILQTITIFRDGNPLSPFFPDHKPLPSIPFSALFTTLHLLIHMQLLVTSPSRLHPSIPPVPWIWLFLTTTAAPTISFFMGKDLPQTLWWSMGVIMVTLTFSIQRWLQEGDEGIKQLEKLKYNAKGA